jgi:hypothetical protein
MIHLRCRCGRTLSVADGDAGREVRCESCGVEVTVPTPPAVLEAEPVRARRAASSHDFDAEIVTESRTRPPRPVKTPERVPPEPAPETGAVDPPPAYDLMRVRAALRWLPVFALSAILVGGAGAAAVFALLRASIALRVGLAVALLTLGLVSFGAALALREVAKSLLGLAGQLRRMAPDDRD